MPAGSCRPCRTHPHTHTCARARTCTPPAGLTPPRPPTCRPSWVPPAPVPWDGLGSQLQRQHLAARPLGPADPGPRTHSLPAPCVFGAMRAAGFVTQKPLTSPVALGRLVPTSVSPPAGPSIEAEGTRLGTRLGTRGQDTGGRRPPRPRQQASEAGRDSHQGDSARGLSHRGAPGVGGAGQDAAWPAVPGAPPQGVTLPDVSGAGWEGTLLTMCGSPVGLGGCVSV